MTMRENFIQDHRNRDFMNKKKDKLYEKEFRSELEKLLKEEIGLYLDWKYTEDLKKLSSNNSLTMGLSSMYTPELSIDKYLAKDNV
jgi:hypothetical protein